MIQSKRTDVTPRTAGNSIWLVTYLNALEDGRSPQDAEADAAEAVAAAERRWSRQVSRAIDAQELTNR